VQVSNDKKTGGIVYYTNKKNELEEGIRTSGRLIRFRSSLQQKESASVHPPTLSSDRKRAEKRCPKPTIVFRSPSRPEPRGAENEIVNGICPKIKLTLSKEEPRSAGSRILIGFGVQCLRDGRGAAEEDPNIRIRVFFGQGREYSIPVGSTEMRWSPQGGDRILLCPDILNLMRE